MTIHAVALPTEERPTAPATLHVLKSARITLPDRLRRDPLHTAITLVLDTVSATAAVGLALLWGAGTPGQAYVGWLPLIFVPALIGLFASRSMYRRSLTRYFLDEVTPVQACIAVAAIMMLAFMLLNGVQGRPGEVTARIWVCAAFLVSFARLARAIIQRVLRRRFHAAAPTLVVGDGRITHQLMERMQQMPEYGLRPVGLLDAAPPGIRNDADAPAFAAVPYLGRPSDFADVARATGAEEVVISVCGLPEDDLVAVVRSAHLLGLRVWVLPRLYDAVGARARVEHLGGLPLLVLPRVNPKSWQFAVKHVMDRGLAALGLIVISPVFLTLAALVRLSSPGPIFFRQKRVGRDGKPFDCLKFRSMRPPRASDAEFELKSGAAPGGVEGVDRRTTVGKIMRKTSLDELPQFINVVRGDMSLVGPRPERPEFVELFEMQIRRYGERHRVKAGVTGWAQVNGLRGQTSIADRAEWDNFYIENWSLWLDVKILFLTVLAVLKSAE